MLRRLCPKRRRPPDEKSLSNSCRLAAAEFVEALPRPTKQPQRFCQPQRPSCVLIISFLRLVQYEPASQNGRRAFLCLKRESPEAGNLEAFLNFRRTVTGGIGATNATTSV